MALVAVVGAVLAVAGAARLDADLGPFRSTLAVAPSLTGDTDIEIPPLGELLLDSHDGPVHLTVRLDRLDQRRTTALITEPDGVAQAGATALSDLGDALVRLGLRTVAVAVLGAVVLGWVVLRDRRRVAAAAVTALALALAALAAGGATFRREALAEPRYEGLLTNAPAVVGDARKVADRYEEYAAQLQKLLTNVGRLYSTVSSLPTFEAQPGTVRALHVSDLHLNPTAWPTIRTVVKQFDVDLVIDTGDITDWGSEPEQSYVDAIGGLGVPYVFIPGNHDSAGTAAAVARQRGAVVLDNRAVQVGGLRLAGIGDPRFTPDKAGATEGKQGLERLRESGAALAATVRATSPSVDVALVHDPVSAASLTGTVPLVLAGHTHQRAFAPLPAAPGRQRTWLSVSGSTGGAGLRGLEGGEPTPLSMSVLYFDTARRLQAYDDIRLGGTGQSQVTLERHVVGAVPPATAAGTRGIAAATDTH
ncbi:membrane protein [Pilimelia terevasa]|uniref:Membrane protein n=1 Tax=Pilimelia terevasa TaxID=53372 RepID=A0A8J3BGE0_9ACTN|nr:membrane protein [Pilimelia terevasa]